MIKITGNRVIIILKGDCRVFAILFELFETTSVLYNYLKF